MNKAKKILASLAFGLAVAAVGGAVAFDNIIGSGSSTYRALDNFNEYGCVANCTAEYEIRHVKSILAERPDLEGTMDVRIICRASRSFWGVNLFQDLDDPADYSTWSMSQMTQEEADGHLMAFDGLENSFKGCRYKAGDLVCAFGEVRYAKVGTKGRRLLTLRNPTVYRVNDAMDLGLLPPAVYLR